MTDAQGSEEQTTTPDPAVSRRNSHAIPLLMVGMLIAFGGLIGGLAAKASADHVAIIANSAKWLVASSSNPIVLTFPKTLGHPLVTADYTGLWVGLIVALLGVMLLSAGILLASVKPRVS